MDDDSSIQSMSKENRKFLPSDEFKNKAYIKSEEEYKKIYEES